MKHIIFIVISMIVSQLVKAQVETQDTISVGVNGQHISVTPPQMNQKVSIKIEDSSFNYLIDISKVPSNQAVIATTQYNPPARDKKQKDISRSGLFREFEMGVSFLPLGGAYISGYDFEWSDLFEDSTFIGIVNTGPQNRTFFKPSGTSVGLYLDATIREKSRKLAKFDNLYFQNSTHLRTSLYNHSGERTDETYFVFESGREDSLISSTVTNVEVWNTQLEIAKRFTFMWDIPQVKDLSLEYGLFTGLRFNLTRSVTERMPGSEVTTSGSDVGLYASNPFIRLNHQLGINYRNYSLNTNISYADATVGSFNTSHIRGKRVNIGLAYRF